MPRVYRPTLIKFGERSESPQSLVWEDEAEDVDTFAQHCGFTQPLQTWRRETHGFKDVAYSAQVYAAMPGVYPRFLLTVDPFDEFHCVLCWDMSDLFQAMTLYGLRIQA